MNGVGRNALSKKSCSGWSHGLKVRMEAVSAENFVMQVRAIAFTSSVAARVVALSVVN